MLSLACSFFLIALLYSLVGFGGGTSYIAVLAASNIPYTMIPKIALFCNIIVVSGGTYHAFKQGHFNKRLIMPFVLSSAPMAFVGGLIPIEESTFFILLTSVLIICGMRLLFLKEKVAHEITHPPLLASVSIGAVLGLLSGMVGIGGGIFLSPLLINLGYASSKEAAAAASLFILINSFFALMGQFTKETQTLGFETYLPLFLVVFIAGQLGSRLGMGPKTSHRLVQKGTGVLTLFICVRLLMKVMS